jgi:PAS domain S-box-containing protein
MRDAERHILIASNDQQELASIAALLVSSHRQALVAEDALGASQVFRKNRPDIAIVNYNMPGGKKLVESTFSERPDVQLILLSDAADMDNAMHEFKDRVAQYLLRPVQSVALEIGLLRADKFTRLQTELKRINADMDNRVKEMTAHLVEDERYLAVRQIIDRMSAFIAQVAGDVHGGVKYFNELPYFVSIHSPECRVLAANPTYLRYLGYRINGNSCAIYSGKRATPENCPVGRTLRTEDVMETRALVKYKSGARIPVIVHTAPIFNDDGEVVLVLEIFAGSKEIEHLAEEVHTTQQRYQQLFDAVPNPIAVLDRRLRFTALNRRFKDDFGNPVGESFFDCLKPGKFPAFHDPITQTLKDGVPHQGELVLTNRNGIQYNMMAATAPIKTLAGKLIQVLVIFTDITQLRQLQDNLSSLGLMIGTVSHDLKGCLTGLDGGLYLIDTGFYRDQPGRIEEGLETAKLMAERMRKQIQDILFYTKERELEIQTIEADAFAEEVAANVDQKIRGADIAFVCSFGPNLGKIEIDPGLVRSTLINILENALAACLEDKAAKSHQISFRANRFEGDILFEVEDNGTGMDAQQIKNIFNIFYTTKGTKGTGLGLFIANKTVQKHGGRIRVDSKTGQGSAFRIRLPSKFLDVKSREDNTPTPHPSR